MKAVAVLTNLGVGLFKHVSWVLSHPTLWTPAAMGDWYYYLSASFLGGQPSNLTFFFNYTVK